MEEYPVSLCWETPVLSLQYALCHYHCTVNLCQINFAAFGWNWAESKALHTWELIQLFLSSSANTSFPLAAIHEDISWLWILTVMWLLSQECPWLVEGGLYIKGSNLQSSRLRAKLSANLHYFSFLFLMLPKHTRSQHRLLSQRNWSSRFSPGLLVQLTSQQFMLFVR